jgi:hypothetical protein
VFILYALVIGVALGLLAGGRPSGLARLDFRWPWVIAGGLFVQLVLFHDAVAAVVGDVGAPIYVASTALVLLGVVRNLAMSGIPVLVLGAVSNVAAIVANGGYMPAGAAAMAALGRSDPMIYSNSVVLAKPALEPLTDVFALPSWLPFANVFSVGDVLIAIGVAWVVIGAMRRPRSGSPPVTFREEAAGPA